MTITAISIPAGAVQVSAVPVTSQYRGNWNQTTTYLINDMVFRGVSTWRAIAVTLNDDPASVTPSGNWVLVALGLDPTALNAAAATATNASTQAAASATQAAASATLAAAQISGAAAYATNSSTFAQQSQTSAVQSQTAAGSATTSATLAQSWAMQMSGTVDGTNYSAAYNANLAATSASAAAGSASASATSATNAATSALTAAAWASQTTGTVGGGYYSAYYYAQQAAASAAAAAAGGVSPSGTFKPGQTVVAGNTNGTVVKPATRTAHGDSAYTIQPTDNTVALTSALSAPRIFTLPAASSVGPGGYITIVDEVGGVSSTNTLTVVAAGSDTVNAGISAVIASAYGYLELESDGTSRWTVIDSAVPPVGTTAGTVAAGNDPRFVAGPTLTDWRNGLVEAAKLRPYIPMIGAAADGFFDQSGIDVANSVNAIYDSTNKLYTNYAVETTQSIPLMTSNSAPSGYTMSASSTYQGSGAYAAWYARDGVIGSSNAWYSDTQSAPWTLTQGLPAAVTLAAYAFCPRDATAAADSWQFQGSNDNNTWTTLDTQSGVAWSNYTTLVQFTIPLANRGAYTYYRFNFTKNNANGTVGTSGYVSVSEWQLFKQLGGPLDLRSATFSASFTPSKGSTFFVLNPLNGGTITVGTNLIASLSQNAGSAYTAMPLTLSGTTLAGYPIYEANGVTLGGSGTQPKWRLQTSGGLGLQVRDAYFKVV